ncbi:MAG: hypothetical protein KAY37_05500 [Phycisphaerae bacterium]|nr:hypothetical protein [Phycisphaerae bacterium]
MSRKILERLAAPELVALRCKGEAWEGSVFSRSLIPDNWMGLVVMPDGRRRFVPAGEDPDPKRDDTLVLVRNRAITVPLEIADVPASGGHPVTATVELLVRCWMREDDMSALRQALLTEDELTLDRLAEACDKAGAATALRSFIREQPAKTLVYDDLRDALLERLRNELQRFLFSAGLELERLGKVEFASASLAEQDALERETTRRVKELEARGMVERTALAATRRRLDDLGDVLSKLKDAADADGNLQWRELLPTLTPGERGRLLENLWRLTPDRTVAQSIVVVAGRECVWLDPAEPERIVRRLTLPEDLGGLRSVTYSPQDEALLIGAGSGVWRLKATNGEIVAKYVVPDAETPRTGFNAAITTGGCLFATHSELGAWSWNLDDPEDVQQLLRPIGGVPKTIRAVTVDERGRVLLAADERVHAFDPAGETAWQTGPADGRIHCLAALEEWLFAGTSTGALLRCDLNLRDAWLPVHRTHSAIESLCARRWDDLVELVIPAGPDGVCGVYVGEGIVSRLLKAATPIRRAWACDDTLVALVENRDRLVILNGDMPERTGLNVPIARVIGHSIQDACLVEVGGPAF